MRARATFKPILSREGRLERRFLTYSEPTNRHPPQAGHVRVQDRSMLRQSRHWRPWRAVQSRILQVAGQCNAIDS